MKQFTTLLIVTLFTNSILAVINYNHIYGNGSTYYRINGNYNFTDNVVIKNRAILVLECGIFKISAGKRITVEPGGQLFLNTAILTQAADASGNSTTLNTSSNWVGIEIQGDGGENQLNQNNQESPCYVYECIGSSSGPSNIEVSVYKQGFLALYKSKIRYSNFGLTFGNILLNSPFASYGDGGGIFSATECSFENNYWRHLYFAVYPKPNTAKLINNDFKYDHNTFYYQQPTFQHTHRDIIARDNSFAYNFENNRFSVSTLYNNFIGIELYESEMRIIGNSFKTHMAGIVMQQWSGGIWNKIYIIQNNIFEECQVGIDVGGIPKVRIDNNVFALCTYPRQINGGPSFMTYFNSSTYRPYTGFTPNQNATVGIYSSTGSYNLQCNKNKFSAINVPLSNEDAALVVWQNGPLTSNFLRNTSNRMVTGFRSIEDNRGFQVLCNTFSRSTKNDILNDQISGRPNSLMSNQGAPNKPTRNVHTNSNVSGRWDMKNENTINYSGANKLKYYYKNFAIREDPINHSSGTVAKSPSLQVGNCAPIIEISTYNPEQACTKKTRIPTEFVLYNEIKDEISELKIGGISEGEQDDYNLLMHDYDLVMVDMIDHFISNSLEYGHNVTDSIKNFLKAHKTMNSYVYLVQLYLTLDSFTRADDYMDTLTTLYPTESFIADYVEYFSLISDYKQNYNDSWLFSHFNDFQTIADSNGYLSSSALAVAQYIAYTDSGSSYFNEMFSYRYLPDMSDTLLTDTLTEEITVHPVPFVLSLSIDIENFTTNSRTFNVILKDLYGEEAFNSNLPVGPLDIDTLSEATSLLAEGLYVLQVFENGILIDVRLITK